MQFRTAQVRINKWLNKFSGERQGVLSLLSKDTAFPEVVKAYNQQVADERRARVYLLESGVLRYLFPYYLNFTREVRGLINQGFAGLTLINQVASLQLKYVAYGLTNDYLDRIRIDIFSIDAPPAP